MLNKMSNASRLVEKLKQKDLVKREECPNDRRQVDVIITENGLKLLMELEIKVNEANQNFVHLSLDEVTQMNDLLDKMRG
jgi:DNA-binding MarR family transcriptional regulator